VEYPEFFIGVRPLRLQHLVRQLETGILQERDPHGRRLIVGRTGIIEEYTAQLRINLYSNFLIVIENWDPSVTPFTDIYSLWTIFALEASRDITTQLKGIVFIFDCKGFNLKMATHTSASVIHMVLRIFLVSALF
jgi:hypothetical protein